MNKTVFISICSEQYLPHYRMLYNSLKQHAPNDSQILYYIGDVQENFDTKVDITEWYNNTVYTPVINKICSLRARVVLDAFNKGFQKVVFLGAKVEFFSSPDEIVGALDYHDAITTPHILEPLPEDGKFPSNSGVSFTGHISTDVIGFYNCPEIIKFLEWQDEIMKSQCITTSQTYLDQSWLNFLPFFVSNVHVFRNTKYNVAYYNYHQRELKFTGGKWMTKDGLLVCFQYSGLIPGEEHKVSKYQNRYVAEDEFLKFLKSYTERTK